MMQVHPRPRRYRQSQGNGDPWREVCAAVSGDHLWTSSDDFTVLPLAYGMRSASSREGQFSVNGDIAKMFNVLFDSGALHHSYINANIVEEHRDKWESMIRPYEAWVKLADQKTVIRTKEIIRGTLSFVSGEIGRAHV